MKTCEKRDAKTLLGLVFMLCCAIVDPRAQAIPPMVAHFPLDETAGADVVDVITGTKGVLSKPESAWIPGKIGGALKLDGVLARVHVPTNAAFDFAKESFSIAFWMRMPTGLAPHHPHLLSKGDYEASEPGGGIRWEFHMTQSAAIMNFTIDDGKAKSEFSASTKAFMTGDWVHVVGIRDTVNKKLLLYASGVLQPVVAPGDGKDVSGSIANPVDLVIGDASKDDNPFPGDLDDIRFFRLALTADQIAAVMAAPATASFRKWPPSPRDDKLT